MREIDVTTKQLSVEMIPSEEVQITSCNAIQNCSNTYVLYSFEPFSATNLGATLALGGLLTMPIGEATIYLKASSQPTHIEAFGVAL